MHLPDGYILKEWEVWTVIKQGDRKFPITLRDKIVLIRYKLGDTYPFRLAYYIYLITDSGYGFLRGKLLASTIPNKLALSVFVINAYRILTVEELPLYVDFKYKTEYWDEVLMKGLKNGS